MPQTTKQRAVSQVERAAALTGILVHADSSAASSDRVHLAARLARDCGARLIGLAAAMVEPLAFADPMYAGYLSGDVISLLREQIETEFKNAEAAFRKASAGAEVEWRAVWDFPEKALARESRAADLIVMAPNGKESGWQKPSTAEVIMRSGRPVLIAPAGARALRGSSVLVAWKDTREARRAISDAMPLLRAADDVIVQAVCDDDDLEATVFQTDDVVAALKRHGVTARANVSSASKEGVTLELERFADLQGADLIVAGAYGHSRAAEWAFGGVTDDLIHRPQRFVFFSH